MEGLRLILNDGTVIENGRAGVSENDLVLWFPNYSLQQVASIVFNKTKMLRVSFQSGSDSVTYQGYTNCTMISDNYTGEVVACMKKG